MPLKSRGSVRARLAGEAAGDHEMHDQEQVALELDDDALADPPDSGDALALGGRYRRVEGAEDDRAPDPDALEDVAYGHAAQRFEVRLDVGQLGHRRRLEPRLEGARKAPQLTKR